MLNQQFGLLEEIWKNVVRHHRDVLIAGGAPRNTLTDLKMKDIDIFLPEDWDTIVSLAKKLKIQDLKAMSKGNPAYSGDETKIKVFEGNSDSKIAYNFIMCVEMKPREQVYKFPDDISRMWIDASTQDRNKAMINYTPEAKRAWLSKHIRITNGSDDRIKRLKELYEPKGYTFTLEKDENLIKLSASRRGPADKHAETPHWWNLGYISPELAMQEVRRS